MEGFCADEYFYYHFADKSEQERASFISDQNRVIFCDTVNKFKNLALFDDKIKTAEMFSEHYRREFCGVRSEADKAAFVRFIEKNPKFIVKPIVGSCGVGVEIADLALTDNGRVMVEGNARGQFIWQISTQEGFLAEANSILRRLGKKEMKKLSM